MGQARHRKKLLTALGPRTKGTGIRYVGPPREPESTPEQLAARELRQHEKRVLEAHKLRKQRVGEKIFGWAEDMVRVWRGEIDKNDIRLKNFAGWTMETFCPLPVDSDLAQIYRTVFEAQQAKTKHPLSLLQRDDVVEQMFYRERHSDRIAAEILRIVRIYIEQALEDDAFNAQDFLTALAKREVKERQRHDWVHKGLEFVGQMMGQAFQEIRSKQ